MLAIRLGDRLSCSGPFRASGPVTALSRALRVPRCRQAPLYPAGYNAAWLVIVHTIFWAKPSSRRFVPLIAWGQPFELLPPSRSSRPGSDLVFGALR